MHRFIGPKGGTATVDNGFARFNRIRIPKHHMLSKFAQVTDDGKYVQPPHAKISYGGVCSVSFLLIIGLIFSQMLYIRVG
jgi:acyl-CoA oxidase